MAQPLRTDCLNKTLKVSAVHAFQSTMICPHAIFLAKFQHFVKK